MSSVSRINPLLAKILLIVALSLVLLLPLGRMESLIAERSALRDSAVERVAHGVGHAQSIGAVMMILPVTRKGRWQQGVPLQFLYNSGLRSKAVSLMNVGEMYG